VYCLRVNAQSNARGINQRTSISEGSLVFIEIEEQLIDSLYMWESAVEENMAFGRTDISGPRPLIPGARSFMADITSEAPGIQSRFASCPTSPRSWVIPRSTPALASIGTRVGKSGRLNRLGPDDLGKLG
jgi:hypothetical protein